MRFIFRRIFFKKLVAHHTRNHDSEATKEMVHALENDELTQFYELANVAALPDLRQLTQRDDIKQHTLRNNAFRGYSRSNLKNARGQWLYGSSLIQRARDAHGSGYADTVSRSAFKDFVAHLESAKEALLKAIQLDPSLADAYAEMLIVYKGQGNRIAALFKCCLEHVE